MRGGKKVVRSKLNPGSMIRVDSGEVFSVDSVAGEGASCVVYLAEKDDGTQHLLKEYNPKRVELYRDSDGTLTPEGDDAEEQFDAGLTRFINGAKKQVNMRRSISDLTNSTCNVQGIYSANGTKYIDMTVFQGQSYEKVKERTLYDLLCRMRALARVIGCYHGNGYLHLDIKPENVFTIPETCEMVMLFDFDSVIEMSSVNSGAGLSYTKTWAAPEQICGKTSQICEATDFFPLGEIVFLQIFGRHSTDRERRSFSKYAFGEDLELCKNVNHKVFRLLEDFFHHTICISSSKRYQSVDPLLAILDEMIPLADPKAPHLVSTQIAPQDFFIGREAEISEITSHLQQEHVLFLSGMGGIGKSELAKRYAALSEKNYDTILFLTYSGSWLTLVTDDICLNIANCSQDEGEDVKEYYYRKMQVLKGLCNPNVLIVIDNLNQDEFTDAESRMMASFLSLKADFLLTSRLQAWEYPCFVVDKLDKDGSGTHCLDLFSHWCPLENETERQAAQDIIKYVDSNTLVVEVIAKRITAGFSSPSSMLAKITDKGLKSSGSEQVRLAKDMQPRRKSAFDHIRNLYNLSELTDAQQAILVNMSIMPSRGINARQFAKLCETGDFNDINHLVNAAWLIRAGRDISMHPVIVDVVMSTISVGDTRLDSTLENIDELCSDESASQLNHAERKQIPSFLLEVSRSVLKAGADTVGVAEFLVSTHSWYSNQAQALKSAERVVQICNATRDDESTEGLARLASAYQWLGQTLVDDGRFEEAEANIQRGCNYLIKAIKTCKKKKDQKCDELSDYSDIELDALEETYPKLMIGTLRKAQGKPLEARRAFADAVSVLVEKLGEDHEMTVTAMDALSYIYVMLGDIRKAEEYNRKAIRSSNEGQSDIDTDVANLYTTKAQALARAGQIRPAINALQDSLGIYMNWDGASSESAANVYHSLAMRHLEVGENAKAWDYLTKYREMVLEMYGEQTLNMMYVHTGFANYYLMQSILDKAQTETENALRIALMYFGEESSYTGDICVALTQILFYQEKYQLAGEYGKRALKIYNSTCGKSSIVTAKACFYFGGCLAAQHHIKAAKKYYKDALQIIAEIYGDDYTGADYEIVLGCAMASCMFDDSGEAEHVVKSIVRSLEDSNGEINPISAEAHYALAVVYWKSERNELARDECQKALSISITCGWNHMSDQIKELLNAIDGT